MVDIPPRSPRARGAAVLAAFGSVQRHRGFHPRRRLLCGHRRRSAYADLGRFEKRFVPTGGRLPRWDLYGAYCSNVRSGAECMRLIVLIRAVAGLLFISDTKAVAAAARLGRDEGTTGSPRKTLALRRSLWQTPSSELAAASSRRCAPHGASGKHDRGTPAPTQGVLGPCS